MLTIKQLAAEAGVSPSTVSIVLGGKSEMRRIPLATQKKVLDTALRLGYRPNISARRLRDRSDTALILTVFWASDFRAPMMIRFLRGLQNAVLQKNQPFEIIIHPYRNDQLDLSLQALGQCNAAIICNASGPDLAFLESRDFSIPVVLYNRKSAKYSSAGVDDFLMGALPAQIFAARGHLRAAVLTSESVFPGMSIRITSFCEEAKKAGITVQIIEQDNSMRGGHMGGLEIGSLKPVPDCVFCLSDYLAIGALRAFQDVGLQVPVDLELISIGNGDRELEEYASTALSVMELPMEEMAETCFSMVLDLLQDKSPVLREICLPTAYITRESCGEA